MNDAEINLQVKLDGEQAKKSVDDISSKTKSLQDSFSKAGKVLTAGLTTSISGLMATGVKYNSQMEQFQAGLTTLLGSSDKASQMLDTLKQMANTTPFETTDLISATQTMLGFGMSAKDSMSALSMLGDVSMGNKDKLSGLSLVFAQVQSQGKLMGQDLLQMINNGFNPLTEISKMTGRSMSDLKDDMSKGAISADMITQAFQHATSQGGLFYQAMDKQSQTVSGRMSTLKDAFDTATGSLTESLLPAFSSAVDKLTQFANWVSNLDDNQKKMLLTVLKIVAGIGPLLLILSKVIGMINVIKDATWITKIFGLLKGGIGSLVSLIIANPIMALIVAGVIAVIAVIVLVVTHFNEIKEVVMNVFNAIGGFFSNLWSTIFTSVTTFFTNLVNSIINFFNPIFTFLSSIVTWIWTNILSPIINFVGNVLIAIIAIVTTLITFIYQGISNLITLIFNILSTIAIWIWSNVLSPIINTITNILSTIWNGLVSFIDMIKNIFLSIVDWIWNNVLSPIFNFFSNIFNGIWNIINGTVENIKNAFFSAKDAVISAFKAIGSTIGDIFNTIGNIIKTPINAIIGGINTVFSGINQLTIPDWVPFLGGKHSNFGMIPKLATGTNYVAGEGLAYLHQGEAVVPKKYNPALGGSGTIALQIKLPDIVLNGNKLGQNVTPYITQTLRTAGVLR